MEFDQNLVFRKAIVPWYDTETACAITAACMFVVFIFSVQGIILARQASEYWDYQWIPVLLAVLSLAVFLSTLARLIIRRYSER
jgi:hypothetical protein